MGHLPLFACRHMQPQRGRWHAQRGGDSLLALADVVAEANEAEPLRRFRYALLLLLEQGRLVLALALDS